MRYLLAATMPNDELLMEPFGESDLGLALDRAGLMHDKGFTAIHIYVCRELPVIVKATSTVVSLSDFGKTMVDDVENKIRRFEAGDDPVDLP